MSSYRPRTSLVVVEDDVLVVLTPPRDVGRRVALGAACQRHVLALPHRDVPRGVLVDDVRGHWRGGEAGEKGVLVRQVGKRVRGRNWQGGKLIWRECDDTNTQDR